MHNLSDVVMDQYLLIITIFLCRAPCTAARQTQAICALILVSQIWSGMLELHSSHKRWRENPCQATHYLSWNLAQSCWANVSLNTNPKPGLPLTCSLVPPDMGRECHEHQVMLSWDWDMLLTSRALTQLKGNDNHGNQEKSGTPVQVSPTCY